MEKIKYSKVRFLYFILFILLAIGLFFQILNPKSMKAFNVMILDDIVMVISSYVFLFFIERKNPYFSTEKVIVAPTKNICIKWDDLEVVLDNYKPNPLNFGAICLQSRLDKTIKTKFELNWFNEKSVLSTIQKHAPKDHELYALINEYAKKRSLKF